MTGPPLPPKAQNHLHGPPPPVGEPFDVGATKALVTSGADGTATLTIERLIRAPAERVYRAFLDPDAFAAWFPPHGLLARVHTMEPKVGGTYRFSFYSLDKTWSSTSVGEYAELVPGRKLVLQGGFENDAGGARLRITVTLTSVEEGTLVRVVNEGIPMPRGGRAPYGWAQSLEKLALLVEPEPSDPR